MLGVPRPESREGRPGGADLRALEVRTGVVVAADVERVDGAMDPLRARAVVARSVVGAEVARAPERRIRRGRATGGICLRREQADRGPGRIGPVLQHGEIAALDVAQRLRDDVLGAVDDLVGRLERHRTGRRGLDRAHG